MARLGSARSDPSGGFSILALIFTADIDNLATSTSRVEHHNAISSSHIHDPLLVHDTLDRHGGVDMK